MSKTKYVEHKDHGFWAYDVALSIFLKYLIDAAEESSCAGTPWLSSQVSSWRMVACIPDIGLSLGENLSTEQRNIIFALSEEACVRLAARDSIPAEEILNWRLRENERMSTRGAKEVVTAPIVELGRAIIALASGELPESPKGEIWLYGTPTGRTTLRMYTR